MASSLSQRGAARAPPPPDQLASFYKLVDKKTTAGVLCRHARDVELSAQAAVQAEELFGEDSLVVASLRYAESESLAGVCVAANGADIEALRRRSWAVLVSLIPPLLRRLEASTLLPGTVREEELEYEAHSQAALCQATNSPVPPLPVLRAFASTLGYNTLVRAMCRSLSLVRQPSWPQHELKMVELFVLQGLDVIPRTAGIPANLILGEIYIVMVIEQDNDFR